jgi:hypothetical protein
MKAIEGDRHAIADQVPCDVVADEAIAAAAAFANKGQLTVYSPQML